MSPDDNKVIIQRYLNETWNKQNLAVIDELVAPDLVQHVRNVTQGRDGIHRFFAMIRGAFPDATLVVEDLMAERDRVVWRFSVRGTHQGAFMGLPATGRPITLAGMAIVRMKAGQIVESWNITDDLSLMQQLGVVPPRGEPPAQPA